VLTAAQAGAPWAFERLYADLAPQVANYVRLRGAAEPEDLTSEVFLAVFERLAAFEGTEAGFRSWVFTIAHNKAVDARRRLTRRPWTEVDDTDLPDRPGGDVETEALAALETGRVYALLAELPDVQRDVLLLRIIADLTVAQVASALNKSPGAVKQHQRRALAHLRNRLEREGVTL
jgi:RNA polymerase sigma factor (sigma-70 family)